MNSRLRWRVVSLMLALIATIGFVMPGNDDVFSANGETLADQQAALISRGEFAVMLAEASGLSEATERDEAVASLRARDILRGYPDGDLALAQPITAVEAVALIARTLGLDDHVALPQFASEQLPADHWGHRLWSWLERQQLLPDAMADARAPLRADVARQWLDHIFTSDDAAIALVEQVKAAERALLEAGYGFRTNAEARVVMFPTEGAEAFGPFDMTMRMTQTVRYPDQLHQSATMTVMAPGEAPEPIAMEMYIIDGRIIQQFPDPETGEPVWMRLPEGLMPDLRVLFEQSLQQTQAVPPGFERYFYYKALGMTTVRGQTAHQIGFYGKIDDFEAFLAVFAEQFPDLQWTGMDGVDALKSVSYWGMQYVDAATGQTLGFDYDVVMRFAEPADDETQLPIAAMHMSLQVTDLHFDPSLQIEVPAEALAAPELVVPES